jgi:ABC-2 type transport system permease protein
VLQNLLQLVIQSLVIVGMALAIGVSFDGGVVGVVVLVLAAGLLGTGFAALSNALALITRQEESLIGAVTFLQLPLTFLSTAFMQPALMPDWIGTVARYNPVDWAIRAGREAVGASTDWSAVAGYCGLLAGFAIACLLLATRAFRAYQAQV